MITLAEPSIKRDLSSSSLTYFQPSLTFAIMSSNLGNYQLDAVLSLTSDSQQLSLISPLALLGLALSYRLHSVSVTASVSPLTLASSVDWSRTWRVGLTVRRESPVIV